MLSRARSTVRCSIAEHEGSSLSHWPFCFQKCNKTPWKGPTLFWGHFVSNLSWWWWWWWWWWLFTACKYFGRMFDHSFPACAFFFESGDYLMHTTSILMPGSLHSGSASWDNCGWVFPDKLRVSSFPDRFQHCAWTAARSAHPFPISTQMTPSWRTTPLLRQHSLKPFASISM